MIVSQPYKTQSWNMTHLQLSSWSEGVGALGLVWAHPMVASSFSLSFFFQCIHPSSFSVCFHVTKNSFHSAHVSIELYRLPAFPLALDSGYISTLKLKGGRKRKHYLLIQSCTAVTYFPSAVINSASWNGGLGGGQIIWLCNMKLPLAFISQSSNNVIISVYCNYGDIFNVLNSSFERSKLMTWENEMAKTKEEKFHKNAELSVSGLSWVDENRQFSCI